LPPDVLTGFLPPEDGTGRGMGYIGYMVDPRASLPTGTPIRNVALITFDQNAAIGTDQLNDEDPSQGTDPAKMALVTIDSGPPTSTVAPLPATTSTASFTVSWSGSDANGSGIAFYNVYVSTDGSPFVPFQTRTTATSATLNGALGHTYGFFSVATDHVGNVQPTPAAAQATTTINVQKAAPTITWANPADIVYGTALSTIQLDATASFGGSAVAGTFTYTPAAGTVPNAGQDQVLAVSFMPSDTADFNNTTASALINVAPAPLMVTADSARIVAGQALPTFTAHFAGFVRGEGPNVLGGVLSFSVPAGAAGRAAQYPITPAGLSSANYAITYVDGTLNVAPPLVTVQSVRWQTEKLSRHKTAKVLVVSFSGALEPGPAENLADYHLATLGKARKSGIHPTRPLALTSAVYSPAMVTVTLTPKGTVPNQTLQLTITAGLVLDAQGQPIEGNQGGNFVATFGRAGITFPFQDRALRYPRAGRSRPLFRAIGS